MKKNRLFAAAMAACLTAVSLAGCGSSSSSETTAAATTAAATESKAEGGDTAAAGDAVGPWKSGDNVYIDVPAKAGGGTDLYTRYLTQALGEVCPGVNFVVTNYDTGEVGMEHTKNAAADGLTLVTCHGGAIIQYLAGSSEVNIKDDLKVVGIMNQGGPQAIIAKPGAPYKNFAELADYIKANPGQVVIGCSLGGTTQVLFTSLVEALTGDANSVNYEVLTYSALPRLIS
jgi:tripartite-type tricarboxylate transporter receptor subunit TctC